MHKLHHRSASDRTPVRGLSCDPSGVYFGGDCGLIVADEAAARRYKVGNIEQINRSFSAGFDVEVDLSSRLQALRRLAELMSEGQWAQAQIAALHLRLPDLPDDAAVDRLRKADDFFRFNPNHRPAGPGGGQFARELKMVEAHPRTPQTPVAHILETTVWSTMIRASR